LLSLKDGILLRVFDKTFLDLLTYLQSTLAVQTTASGVSARLKKIAESPLLPKVREAGWKIHVHGWRKNAAGKYVMRIVDIS
jgi:hypothetical protein